MADFETTGPCLGRVVPNDFKDFIHIDFPVRGLISLGRVARHQTACPHICRISESPLCGFMP